MKETLEILADLSLFYPRVQLNQASVVAMAGALADIEPGLLKAACDWYKNGAYTGSNTDFYPSVAALRACACEVVMMAKGIPSPDEAWGLVGRAIRRTPRRCTPESGHAIIDEVASFLGWERIRNSSDEGIIYAQFARAYKARVERFIGIAKAGKEVVEYIEGGKRKMLT